MRADRPLTDLEAWLRQGTVELQLSGASHNDSPPPQLVPSDAGLNDEAACQMDGTDAASIAAATSSEFGPTCNPDRRWAFWTWWLQEAPPAAASRGSLAPRQPPGPFRWACYNPFHEGTMARRTIIFTALPEFGVARLSRGDAVPSTQNQPARARRVASQPGGLAEVRQASRLTAEEFEAAKRKLLG